MILDVFKRKEFGLVSLTSSINLQPTVPGRLAKHFPHKGIRTTTAYIEEKYGQLSIIPSAARGAEPTVTAKRKRGMRSFVVPHFPHNGQILAADLQDLRSFNGGSQLVAISEEVDEVSESLAADHQITWERLRAGAIQGIVLDADNSVIHNYFDEFNITETVVQIDPAVPNSFRDGAAEISRHLEDAMMGMPTGVPTAYCGDQFWDAFRNDAQIQGPFDLWFDGKFARQGPRQPFEIWDINWEEYRTKLGANYFIDRNVARIVVNGPKMFEHISAPADTMKATNTKGRPMYLQQEPMRFDKGINFHSQSNPLFMPRRPKTLIKVEII